MEKKYIKPEITIEVGYVKCMLQPESGVVETKWAMSKERNSYDENENKYEENYGEIQNTIW